MKTYNFDDVLAKQLKNPEFKKAWDDLAAEYDLAAEVIRMRMKRNLTQTQLARLVGTSQPAIARLESGNHRNVTLSFLYRVARALEVRPELKFVAARRPRKTSLRTRKAVGASKKSAGRRKVGHSKREWT
jgi:DNA-binding Xre family transcriptional regulator